MKEKVFVAILIFLAATLLMGSSCRRLSAAHLMSAACNGDIKKVTNLLELGVDVNATDGMSNSALTLAEGCKREDAPTRVQLIELLIAKGAELNHRDSEGCTVLMNAAGNGDTLAVNALLQKGATVNAADKDGETALMKAAASSCSEETVRALLSARADLSARDHKGRNALDRFRSSHACPESRVGDLLERAGTEKGR
jgi:26S proteasome non-ATPase regulatory subunit 10